MIKTIMKNIIIVVLAFLFFVGAVFIPVLPAKSVNAASATKYSTVLEDLKKDENFDVSLYPSIADDYSLKLIQIAESSDGELFLYVYQPSHETKDLIAKTVRIAILEVGVEVSYKDYTLSLISSYGVFDKYIVKGLNIPTTTVRYYEVVQLERAWDSSIDNKLDNGNVINTVPYEVGQQWSVYSIGTDVSYSMITSEVITITDKYVGSIEYPNGFKLYIDRCDSHFVAFSTDRPIDKLIEADVYYISRYYEQTIGMGQDGVPSYGNPKEHYAYLTYTQVAGNTGDGFLGKKYSWNRIESVSDFCDNLEDISLSEADRKGISGKQWVLRFAETPHEVFTSAGYTYIDKYVVSEVTILRLKFETDGVVYNLGVVDNKQTGSENTDSRAIHSILEDFGYTFLAVILIALGGFFLFIILWFLLPVIFKVLWWIMM